MINELKNAGLTETESKVYEALLEFGPSQAGFISRKTGLHRRVVYDISERLIQKGVIGYILKNNKKLFQASNPNRLIEILEEKKKSILEVLPLMLTKYQSTKKKEETNFYKGKEGLKTVFEDQIETGEEIKIIGASPLAYDILQFYFKWFDKKRAERRIKTKIIFNKLDKLPKIPLSEIRILPEKYSSPLAINIYGDKVAIILWSKENPIAIVIKNKEISDGYAQHFELIWKISKII